MQLIHPALSALIKTPQAFLKSAVQCLGNGKILFMQAIQFPWLIAVLAGIFADTATGLTTARLADAVTLFLFSAHFL